ncbi:MAG: regulator [Alloprevotella sp.]
MKRFLLTTLCSLLSLWLAAAPIGGWNLYMSYRNCTDNIPVGDKVYALYSGNLLIYDSSTTEVRTFDKLDGLHSTYIKYMGYSATQNALVLLFKDNNIDILFLDNMEVCNLPNIKDEGGQDISTKFLTVSGDRAVIGTGTGIMLLDVPNIAVTATVDFGEAPRTAACTDSRIYVGLQNELRSIGITQNLADKSLWTVEKQLAAVFLQPFAGGLYFMSRAVGGSEDKAGLWYFSPDDAAGSHTATFVTPNGYEFCTANSRQALMRGGTSVHAFDATDPLKFAGYYTSDVRLTCLKITEQGKLWASLGEQGLVPYALNAESKVYQPSGSALSGFGPWRDYAYHLNYVGDRLLVAGGRLPYYSDNRKGTLMYYENDEWYHFSEDIPSATLNGLPYRDVCQLYQDPNDANRHWAVGTEGLFEFRNLQCVKHYDYKNSPLISALGRGYDESVHPVLYMYVYGAQFDPQGNLWMVNNRRDTALQVLRPDGSWYGVYAEALKMVSTADCIRFDNAGRLWVLARRTTEEHTSGVLCVDWKGTLDNRDDVALYRTSATNEDGTNVSLESAYAWAQDLDGKIWIGTENGMFVVDDPSEWFASGFLITQVKVPRNDGTNYADYLLDGVPVSAIAIDAANRKWVGTADNGLYLISADGTEILAHYTAADSPLLSDEITDLAIRQSTGEVMIATDLGLCSFQGDASMAFDTLDKSNIKVYPNPVRPEYSGRVVVTGLTLNAEVKIVTVGGQLVRRGTSTGGTFTWDVCNDSGRRVAPGVYYIMAATADGKDGVAAKVTVI